MLARLFDLAGRYYWSWPLFWIAHRLRVLAWIAQRARLEGVAVLVLVRVPDAELHVLLVHHTYARGWYLPGGGIKEGQSLREAARAELYEETRCSVAAEALVDLGSDVLSRFGGRVEDTIHYFMAQVTRKELPAFRDRPTPGEIEAVELVPLSDIEKGRVRVDHRVFVALARAGVPAQGTLR
jgi:8-oxo-dGTP pyrophosphatase MutT (NUDIX family)